MLRHITEWCSRAYRHARTYERERDDGMSVGSCEAVREAPRGCVWALARGIVGKRERGEGGQRRVACYITLFVTENTKPSLVLPWHVVYDVTYHDVRVRVCVRERERKRESERERASRGWRPR